MSDDRGVHENHDGVVGEQLPRGNLDDKTFSVVREELRTTFEYQVQRLQEIDAKAIEILKANLLLIGIVVTGGSILVQAELDIGLFLNLFTVFGSLLLLVSTGLAAVTYTASNLRGGLDADAIEAIIAAEYDGDEFEQQLLRSYARWIEYNARVTAVNDILATVTVILVFVSFVYIVAGIAAGALLANAVLRWTSFAVMTLFAIGFVWLVYNMDHLGPAPPDHETFGGVRLSKGASRHHGMADLLAMLGRSPPENDDDRS